MTSDTTSTILCALVALAAAMHIPDTAHTFIRKLCRWIKPLEKRPTMRKCAKALATAIGILIIPAHFYFYTFEAWVKASHT